MNAKTLLITGGTGSLGKTLCRIILNEHAPEKVIIYSRDELKQHEMRMVGFDDSRIRYFIGDVRDKDRLNRAMSGVDIVVHAAAINQHVNKVLAVSTDKAVNPVNLYGATKLVAEKLFVQGNVYAGVGGTKF